LVACRRCGSVEGRRRLVGDVVTSELSTMLAGKSKELIALATLWHLDAILVGPFLDL